MTMNQGWSGQESNLHLQCSSQAMRPLHYRSKSLALPLTASHTRGALPVVGQQYECRTMGFKPIHEQPLRWLALSQPFGFSEIITARCAIDPGLASVNFAMSCTKQ